MHTIATQVKGNLHALAALAARERNRRAKHQASNTKRRSGRFWSLVFGASLELGACPPSAVHPPLQFIHSNSVSQDSPRCERRPATASQKLRCSRFWVFV